MTPDEYIFINKKYGDLIYKISHRITGDKGTCSVEDNIQDLWVAAYNALEGYKKQKAGSNGTFAQFKDTEGFNKYIKTVLWNFKNTKGTKATKHKEHFGSSVCIQEHKDTLADESIADSSGISAGSILPVKLTTEEQEALAMLIKHPNIIKPSGGIDCTKLSRHLGTYWKKAKRIVDSIQTKMENSL